jgi:hypothetical protein
MDGEAGAQWELSKENIQPLKQGRKVAKLNTILHQHQDEDTARQIQEERRQFEEELRESGGEDPLDPWYRYIQVSRGGAAGGVRPRPAVGRADLPEGRQGGPGPRAHREVYQEVQGAVVSLVLF